MMVFLLQPTTPEPKGFQLKKSCANLPSCLSHQRYLDATQIDRTSAQECHKTAATANLATQSILLCFCFCFTPAASFLPSTENFCVFRGRAPLPTSDFWQQLKELVWRDCCVPRPVSWLQIGPIVLSSQPGCPHLTFQVVQVFPLRL